MRSWLNCVFCAFEIPFNIRGLGTRIIGMLFGCMVVGQLAFAGIMGGGNWEIEIDGGFELECMFYDCYGDCNGSAIVDCNGSCWPGDQDDVSLGNGVCNDTGYYTANFFCAAWNYDEGDCCGGCSVNEPYSPQLCYEGIPSWVGDGYCDSSNNIEHCLYDEGDCCPGDCVDGDNYSCVIYGGTCGDCIDPDSSDTNYGGDCEMDCNGVPGGDGAVDCMGLCNGDSFLDCEGQCTASDYWNWTDDSWCDDGTYGFYFDCAEFDCDGGACEDCNGTCNGSAYVDECGGCVAGTTGDYPCAPDCNGTYGGSASMDSCGDCVGGNTGQAACSQDCAGTWGGSAYYDDCDMCVEGTTGYYACIEDCADGHGVLENWLGDGLCDGVDQYDGADLSCYECDNGDCGSWVTWYLDGDGDGLGII